MHAHLAEYVNPFNGALSFPDVRAILDVASERGRAMLEALITQQAAIIAYANDFKLLMYLTVIAIPLVFIIGSARHAPGPAADDAAAVID